MNRQISFIHLDIYTIKPYIKSIILLIGLSLVMGIAFQSVSIFAFTLMLYLMLMAPYPFSIGETNGLDTLYATLPMNRGKIVIARYVFILLMEACGMIMISLLALFTAVIFAPDVIWNEFFLTMCVLSFVFSLIVAFQYPLYFKLGYTKAKWVATIPLFIFCFGIAAVPMILTNKINTFGLTDAFDRIFGVTPVFYLVPVALGLLMLTVSCGISCKIYEKRNL